MSVSLDPRWLIVLLLTGCFSLLGCEQSATPVARTPNQLSDADEDNGMEDVASDSDDEDVAEDGMPAPVIAVNPPGDWKQSPARPLPAEDHGFSIALNHPSGMSVTLYQYTRGRDSISNDLSETPLKDEFLKARQSIHAVVELKLGHWDAAKEIDTDTVTLGDSQQRALWSRFELEVKGDTVISDIYVWPHDNAFLKLRCTGRSDDELAHDEVLKPLLTSLGRASENKPY